MKLLAIFVICVQPTDDPDGKSKVLAAASDLTHVGWFQRSRYLTTAIALNLRRSALQLMTFTAKTVSERTQPGQRHVIDDPDYSAYIYRPSNQRTMAIVAVTDKEYPSKAANCIGPQISNEFQQQFLRELERGTPVLWPALDEKLKQFQQPQQAMDKISKIQTELDATKEVMHQNIEQVLNRGERLDDLLARTQELDTQTKLFVKTAKKANRGCCSLQ